MSAIVTGGGTGIGRACSLAHAELGPVEVLVDNAGATVHVPMDDLEAATDAVFRDLSAVNRELAAASMLGRETTPDDVAAVVLGLVASGAVTGRTVVVDGGRTL